MSSIRPQAFTGGLQDILNLDKDTREVSINDNGYAAGGEKPTGFFSSLTMTFRCFFRSNDEVSKNNDVFEQVKKDINKLFGDNRANEFNEKMQSKIDMGSPLTKGALMRFLNQQELSSLKLSEASTTTVTTDKSSQENTAELKTKIETQLKAVIAQVIEQNPKSNESELAGKIIGDSPGAKELQRNNPEMIDFLKVIEGKNSQSADTLLQELFKGAKTTQSKKSTLAATDNVLTTVNKALAQLEQRGVELEGVKQKTDELRYQSDNFAKVARELRKQQEGQNSWNPFKLFKYR